MSADSAYDILHELSRMEAWGKTEAMIRRGLAVKVLCTVAMQWLFTGLCTFALLALPMTLSDSTVVGLELAFMLLLLIVMIILMVRPRTVQTYPANISVLLWVTISTAGMCAITSYSFCRNHAIWSKLIDVQVQNTGRVLFTGAVFVGVTLLFGLLTLVAVATRDRDFMKLRHRLTMCHLAFNLISAVLSLWLLPAYSWTSVLMTVVSVLLYCQWIITHLNHLLRKDGASPDDWVAIAIMLIIDLTNVFQEVLLLARQYVEREEAGRARHGYSQV